MSEEELESKRQKCEIYSRVVGYVRRIDAWNCGKQAEFHDRKLFDVDGKGRV